MIFDITRRLDEKIEIYPGDPPFRMERIADPVGGWIISSFGMCTHTGSHMDAPSHISGNGTDVAEIPIKRCIGPAVVIEMENNGDGRAFITFQQPNLTDKIVLLKTSINDPYREVLNVKNAEMLAKAEPRAVGTDAFSIGNIEVHRIFLEKGIPIYERLDLDNINVGEYFFIGLPIKLGADAAPVRAVLIQNEEIYGLTGRKFTGKAG